MIQCNALIVGAGPVGLFQVFELGLLGLRAHPSPGDSAPLQYTTARPALQRRLDVREAESTDVVAQPPPRVAARVA
ncbi:hypothetical protein [Frateuria soli]|uniref:hypothetical protein n=1 Tax=Frateuria soli TaxID=1542730 RepID=UPI001E584DF9|nr:hypothetical protein [Frateuria soli]UGB37406.1 hypothetical protein LQ771_11285 [Frateuria soli]